ncbi:MAG: DUF819 family protein [Prevotellaceae bacterium]|nr:DUF819 family protein [Prevotellaceae bacterium]
MTRVIIICLIYVFAPVLIIELYKRYKFCKSIGTIIMAYAIGIIMALTGFSTSETAPMIGTIQNLQNEIFPIICVPLAIPLMLFSCDFKSWMKNFKKTIVAFVTGIIAISVTVIISAYFFKDKGIEELPKAAGIMLGFYTGGTPNVASLKLALGASPMTYMLVNSFEIMISFFFLLFLVLKGFKLFRKVMIYVKDDEAITAKDVSAESFEDYHGFFKFGNFRRLLLPLGLAIAMLAVTLGLSFVFVPKDYIIVSVILAITTIAIVLSFWDRIRNTPKLFEAGMYFILMFSIAIASAFRIDQVKPEHFQLFLFILCITVGCVVLHFLLAKLCKVDADLFTVSAVGLIFSPPFVPIVAGMMNSRRALISGIVVGLLGYAVGTYLGVGICALLTELQWF